MTTIFDSASPPSGARATETAHRKIELQSPDDLAYLIANAQTAARRKIDRDLPPDGEGRAEGGDGLRRRVEELVEEYIHTTFNLSKDNLSINGMDSAEMEAELRKAQEEGQEIEPFNPRLAQSLQSLSAQIEAQTLALATLRRTAPGETARKFEEGFVEGLEGDERRLRKEREAGVEAAGRVEVGVEGWERGQDMREAWRSGEEGLGQLTKGLGGTVERLEKAGRAMEVVEGR